MGFRAISYRTPAQSGGLGDASHRVAGLKNRLALRRDGTDPRLGSHRGHRRAGGRRNEPSRPKVRAPLPAADNLGTLRRLLVRHRPEVRIGAENLDGLRLALGRVLGLGFVRGLGIARARDGLRLEQPKADGLTPPQNLHLGLIHRLRLPCQSVERRR